MEEGEQFMEGLFITVGHGSGPRISWHAPIRITLFIAGERRDDAGIVARATLG
jgi:hypothetical protein